VVSRDQRAVSHRVGYVVVGGCVELFSTVVPQRGQ
jgi:hypothetical protein